METLPTLNGGEATPLYQMRRARYDLEVQEASQALKKELDEIQLLEAIARVIESLGRE